MPWHSTADGMSMPRLWRGEMDEVLGVPGCSGFLPSTSKSIGDILWSSDPVGAPLSGESLGEILEISDFMGSPFSGASLGAMLELLAQVQFPFESLDMILEPAVIEQLGHHSTIVECVDHPSISRKGFGPSLMSACWLSTHESCLSLRVIPVFIETLDLI